MNLENPVTRMGFSTKNVKTVLKLGIDKK